MKYRTAAILSLLMLFSSLSVQDVSAAAKNMQTEKRKETTHERAMRRYKEQQAKEAERRKKEAAKKTVWDESSNPYFKGQKPQKHKKENVEENGPKRSTFKRRIYTGPKKDEIFKAAEQKAQENFNSFLYSEEYAIHYGKISYNVESDTLFVNDLTAEPKKKNANEPPVPYLIKMKEIILSNFNIGEMDGTPLIHDDGELTARKIEIPIWNEKRIKKGKVELDNLSINGEIVKFLKEKEGKFQSLEVKGLKSEKIINETVLNNVVRSKIFSASSGTFKNGEMKKEIVKALKEQSLDGFSFSEARVNGQQIPTFDGVVSALTSYSARILNTDMVWGARLEAKKGKQAVADPEQFKKNADENKAAVQKLENGK